MRGALAALALLGGCTLSGLGEDLEQTTCAGEPPSFCEELNALAPTGDECQRWACDTSLERPVCAVLPRDLDLDGAPALGCEPGGVIADCDDEDGDRAPGLAERCDGIDNDCNELADDGAWTASAPIDVVDFGAAVQHVVVAAAPSGGDLAAAVTYATRSGGPAGVPGAALLPSLAPEVPAAAQATVALVGDDATEFTLQARATSAFFDGTGDLIGLVADPSGDGGRLMAGNLGEGVGRTELVIDELVDFTDGFAASAPSSHVAVATNPARTIALAAFLGHDPQAVDACGGITADAQVVAMTTGPLGRGQSTVLAGSHTDPSPPAVTALGDDAFLLATANATAIELRQITVVDGEATLGPLLFTQTATATAGQLALARSADDRIMLAWRDGCAAAAALRVRALDWTGAALVPAAAPIELAPGGGAALLPEQPEITPIVGPGGGWWITWTRGDAAVVGTRVDPVGRVIEELDLWGDATVRFGLDVVPTGDALHVMAYDEAGGHVLRAVTLTCDGE